MQTNRSRDPAVIPVWVVSDHPLLRAGIRVTLEMAADICLVGESESSRGVRYLRRAKRPSVVLLDPQTSGITPLEFIIWLRRSNPEVQVVLINAPEHEPDLHEVMAAGVLGCLLWSEPPEALIEAIRSAAQGHMWLSQRMVKTLAQVREVDLGPLESYRLTARELEVLRRAAQGLTNREIARALCISERTVRFHLGNVYAKLGVRTWQAAIAWAMRFGLGVE